MEQNETSQTGCMCKGQAIRNIFKSQNRFLDLEVSNFLPKSWFSIGSNCILILVHKPRSYCPVLVYWDTTALTVVTVDQSGSSLVDPLIHFMNLLQEISTGNIGTYFRDVHPKHHKIIPYIFSFSIICVSKKTSVSAPKHTWDIWARMEVILNNYGIYFESGELQLD